MKSLKIFLRVLFSGSWSAGFENYQGKPKFGFFSEYYDGMHYVFHAGNFWIELDEFET